MDYAKIKCKLIMVGYRLLMVYIIVFKYIDGGIAMLFASSLQSTGGVPNIGGLTAIHSTIKSVHNTRALESRFRNTCRES
jgi:hypothetical protein